MGLSQTVRGSLRMGSGSHGAEKSGLVSCIFVVLILCKDRGSRFRKSKEGKLSKETVKTKKSKDTDGTKRTKETKKSTKTDRSTKSKNDQKLKALTKPQPVTLFLGLEDMNQVSPDIVPEMAPCWDHFIYIVQSRDIPLDLKDVRHSAFKKLGI
ncbi:hypothetical protein K0M31_016662 [Melipona bicolor]|uniref:Uncharacterized protein n=1 Tax=Melipona bicolor TaxID=60889 RepID=A0AA40KEQ2_9HYME|nr:hypothetical protein K0M31_016662 [Melipona bicolor]